MPAIVPTLRELTSEFFRLRRLKPKSQKDYEQKLAKGVGDWMDLKILEINGDMVVNRHRDLSLDSGEFYANSVSRILRSLFNFARVHYTTSDGKRLVRFNPVDKVSELRMWNKEPRRQTVIRRHQLPKLFCAMVAYPNRTITDQLIFVWLTGCKIGEASGLKWCDVDLDGGFVTFKNTQFNNDHLLPVSAFLLKVLRRRRAEKEGTGEFVFPGRPLNGKGPLKNNYAAIEKLAEITGIPFRNSDLRSSFISIAQSINVPPLIIKKLVNHNTTNEATAGYVVFNPEDLRFHMERITCEILKLSEYDKLSERYGIESDMLEVVTSREPCPFTDITVYGGVTVSRSTS